MLRRKPDNMLEFRLIEATFAAAGPFPLATVVRERMRDRVFAQLGEQEGREPRFGFTERDRWIAIPAGIGIAASIVAAIKVSERPASEPEAGARFAQALGSVFVDGRPATEARTGQRVVANGEAWLTVGASVRINLEDKSEVQLEDGADSLQVHLHQGQATIATTEEPVTVYGPNWSAVIGTNSVAEFASSPESTLVRVYEGLVLVSPAGGEVTSIRAGDPPVVLPVAKQLPVGLGVPAETTENPVPARALSSDDEVPAEEVLAPGYILVLPPVPHIEKGAALAVPQPSSLDDVAVESPVLSEANDPAVTLVAASLAAAPEAFVGNSMAVVSQPPLTDAEGPAPMPAAALVQAPQHSESTSHGEEANPGHVVQEPAVPVQVNPAGEALVPSKPDEIPAPNKPGEDAGHHAAAESGSAAADHASKREATAVSPNGEVPGVNAGESHRTEVSETAQAGSLGAAANASDRPLHVLAVVRTPVGQGVAAAESGSRANGNVGASAAVSNAKDDPAGKQTAASPNEAPGGRAQDSAGTVAPASALQAANPEPNSPRPSPVSAVQPSVKADRSETKPSDAKVDTETDGASEQGSSENPPGSGPPHGQNNGQAKAPIRVTSADVVAGASLPRTSPVERLARPT